MRRLTMMVLALLAVALVVVPLLAQTRADSVRAEAVRSRGFIRAAETQLSKVLALLDAPPPAPGPPVVLDWKTGEWGLNVGGYLVALDLDAAIATAHGVTAPVVATFAGDTLRARLAVPGYDAGLLELVHSEGRLIGAVAYGDSIRPAAGQRAELKVVRTVARAPCTFAQFTDGSWGVSPNDATCHQALDGYAGPLRYVARTFTPEQ